MHVQVQPFILQRRRHVINYCCIAKSNPNITHARLARDEQLEMSSLSSVLYMEQRILENSVVSASSQPKRSDSLVPSPSRGGRGRLGTRLEI